MEIGELYYQTDKLVTYLCRESNSIKLGHLKYIVLVSSFSPTGAHLIAQFSKKLLDEDISIFSGSVRTKQKCIMFEVFTVRG